MRHRTLQKLICVFLVSTIVCIFCVQSSEYKSYDVPSIVVSKNTEQYAHIKYHINIITQYMMCVKPNDTDKFKHYSLYVDYTTYCTHNVGDKITFSVSENEVLRDFKSSIWIEYISIIVIILFGILSIFSFAGIISIMICDRVI